MRILAFSDLHCDRDAAQDVVLKSAGADMVVGAGDFGICGERSTELFDILRKIAVPLLIVSGNHDRPLELESYCATEDNLYFLDGSLHEINGVTFFGLGGEIPSRSDAKWNSTLEEEAADKLLLDASTHQVLVTHTPPLGACDLQKDGTHEGSEAIAGAIKRDSPAFCLCGHIHHSWGCIERLGKTTVHNLGPIPSWHTIST